jgi:hypothetical protein
MVSYDAEGKIKENFVTSSNEMRITELLVKLLFGILTSGLSLLNCGSLNYLLTVGLSAANNLTS